MIFNWNTSGRYSSATIQQEKGFRVSYARIFWIRASGERISALQWTKKASDGANPVYVRSSKPDVCTS